MGFEQHRTSREILLQSLKLLVYPKTSYLSAKLSSYLSSSSDSQFLAAQPLFAWVPRTQNLMNYKMRTAGTAAVGESPCSPAALQLLNVRN